MDIIINYKEINDAIHGSIKISNIACMVIDTLHFQRLKYLHQLGACHYVFPSATHTRFEHSIGTYYLVGKVLDNIKNNSDQNNINNWLSDIPELTDYYKNKNDTYFKLDIFVCELVKIAGLCHDLGHGPFSHVFDDVFIKSMNKSENPLNHHENRSIMIINHIVNSNGLLKEMIGENELNFIKKLINPTDQDNGFIFQIVSNNLNSIDVDKFDYIMRDTKTLGLNYGNDCLRIIDDMKVIDNIICYPAKIYYDIMSIFKTRYRLHKQIYCHKVVISIQYMINDIMILLDPIVKFYDMIFDLDKFSDLTDDYVISTLKFLYHNKENYTKEQQKNINDAYVLWLRINTRQLYKFIGTIVSDKEIELTAEQFSEIDPNNILVHQIKIGFVSGKKDNPLSNTYFYKKKIPNKSFKITKEQISYLIPNIYQEYIYVVFIKNNNIVLEESVKNTFNEIQSKIIKS